MRQVLFALLSLSLFINDCRAEDIPPGCYVADYYRTDPCWYALDNFYTWTLYPRTTGEAVYGPAMEAIINQWGVQTASLDICVNDYNSLVSSFNYNLDILNAQTKLIKKLRKKCGSACKRVK